jgi:hypothetical protein
MKSIKYLVLVLVTQFSLLESYGQKIKVVRDFIIIQEVEAVKSLADKWEFNLGAKLLAEKDASRLGEFDLEAGISFKPIKIISIGLGYRWSESRNKYNDFVIKNRLSGDIEFALKTRRLKTDYRIRYQNIDDDYFQSDVPTKNRNILRNRLQMKYNVRNSRLFPFLSVEYYGQIGEKGKFGIKLKSALGAGYSINKKHSIKAYFKIDRELNAKNPYLFYGLGACYTFNF